MTSQAAVPFVEVISRVTTFDICSDNGAIKLRSDPVWAKICQIWKLPSRKYLKTSIALYFDFKQNRNDIFQWYIQERCLNFSLNNENKFTYLSSDDEESIDAAENKDKFISFNITFSTEEWVKIKPVQKVDPNKKIYYYLMIFDDYVILSGSKLKNNTSGDCR